MNTVILIPALNPDEKLIQLVRELKSYHLQHFIIIDDGSAPEYQYIFDQLESSCDVYHHEVNHGKGNAIKTGICAAIDLYGTGVSVITADADGQHRPLDIARIAEAMDRFPRRLILGTRNFTQKQVPWKSRWGNRISSAMFRLTTGTSCPDTQTGLRGIPANLLPLALRVKGDRYEYEMNFLTEAAEVSTMEFVPIETVYEDNNAGSHFRPIQDSVLIYDRLIRYTIASLTGSASDYTVFYFCTLLLVSMFHSSAEIILVATVIARCFSGSINFLLNKYWSFESERPMHTELPRYLLLFLVQMGLSAVGTTVLSLFMHVILSKIIVDSILFFLSYAVQKRWVFNPKGDRYAAKTQLH